MSTLESIVLPIANSQSLVEHGIVLDTTALVWIAVHELDDDSDEPTIFPRADALNDEGVPIWNFVAAPTLTELVNAVRDKVGNPLEERTVILTHDGHREVACCAGVRSARGKYEIAYNDTDLQALATLLMEVSK